MEPILGGVKAGRMIYPAHLIAPNYHKVDINSVKTSESKSIGAEYVIAEQMNRYGFAKILQGLAFSAKQIDYAKHLIIGRAVHPSSEREAGAVDQ